MPAMLDKPQENQCDWREIIGNDVREGRFGVK